jgi:hypothetical protein
MRDIELGAILLTTGVGLAAGFDSVALTSIGSFIAGVGLGFITRGMK